jgi:hypothetical protein
VQLSDNIPSPDINVQVNDWDQLGRNDVLGRFTVPVSKVERTNRQPRPKWNDLYLDDPKDTSGRLLSAFQLIQKEIAHEIPLPNLEPELRDCTIQIAIIGVRNLPPYQFRDVVAPMIEFDMGDRTDASKILRNSKPLIPTSNPTSDFNFVELIDIPYRLPIEELYSPWVNVRLTEQRVLTNVVVGNTAVPIREFSPWGRHIRKERERVERSRYKPVRVSSKSGAAAAVVSI